MNPMWSSLVPAALLTAGNGVTAILAAAVLDYCIVRPGPGSVGSGSITPLLPGLAYACATVMKVCLVAGVLSLTITLGKWALGRIRGAPLNASARRMPAWGVSSVALAPLTTLIGAVAAVGYQRLAVGTEHVSVPQFQMISPAAVYIMLVALSAGVVAAVVSLVRREGTLGIPVLGLAVNTLLIGLFRVLEFYAIGFDQDTWAP